MSKHVINIDDFKDYVHAESLVGSYGKDENKKLDVVIIFSLENNAHISFRGKVVKDTESLREAIEAYNSI